MDTTEREKKPLLTLSIAAYNVEKYIEKCILSGILDGEDREKIEIIVVNDGSTDGTLKKIKNISDNYPNIIRIIDKKNGGYGSTINESIKLAEGKYFKLLDGDDWLDTAELKNLVNELENIDEDMLLMDYKKIYMERDNIIEEERCGINYLIKKEVYSYQHIKNIYITNPGSAIKTTLLKNEEIKLQENCFYTDHMFIFFCIAHSKSFKYIDNAMYQYRLGRDGQSVSLQGLLKHTDDTLKVLNAEFDYLRKIKLEPEQLDIIHDYMAILAKDVIVCNLLHNCTPNRKQQIKSIDKTIKQKNYYIYKKMEKINRSIKILRSTKYIMYKLCHYNELRKCMK